MPVNCIKHSKNDQEKNAGTDEEQQGNDFRTLADAEPDQMINNGKDIPEVDGKDDEKQD